MWNNIWAKMRGFVTNPIVVNPVILFTIILVVLLLSGAVVFGVKEISYVHPGPAIAAMELAIFILIFGLIVGLVIHHLQTQNRDLVRQRDNLQTQNSDLSQERGTLQVLVRDLQTQNDDLFQQKEALQAKNSDLEQKLDKLQAPCPLPRIIGLELLVERWKEFKPNDNHIEILNEQISIVLSIAQLHYYTNNEMRFIKYFHGTKIKGGAFLLTAMPNIAPFVLKFDSVTNITKEKRNYEHCVQEFLGNTPGEPWEPHQRPGRIETDDWGAVAYNFVGQGTNPDALRRLQTFGEYYIKHNDAQITDALNKIFEALQPWWIMQYGWPVDCGRGGPQSLYDEYDRLARKLEDMKKGLEKVRKALAIDPQKTIEDLSLRNPFQWVEHIFETENLGNWINQRFDSIVHGDFHAGNILFTTDNQGNIIQPWVIDFPHTHVGPTIQDIARLEADIKFGLLSDDTLKVLGINDMYQFEVGLLPKPQRNEPRLVDLRPSQNRFTDRQLQNAWEAIRLLRREARRYMTGDDARPYYLALLHATLPVLYYRDRNPWQKLYAFISAAMLCERLGGWMKLEVNPYFPHHPSSSMNS